MKKGLIWVVIICLVAIAVFTSVRYFVIEYQHNALKTELRASKFYSETLEGRLKKQKEQYDAVVIDMGALETKLKDRQVELDAANKELGSLEEKIDALNKESAGLKENLVQANQDKNQIQTQLDAAKQDKVVLEEKFNSIDALKQAIRDLKIKMRQARLDEAKKPRVASGVIESAWGNKGFVILNGKPTLITPQIKIEVSPIP